MVRIPVFLLLALVLLCACDSGNPVAPPETPTPQPNEELTVTVTSDRGRLDAGSATGAMLTITAMRANGAAAPDGAEVKLNTNLGNFGVDAGGQPMQLVTAQLAGGVARVQFFAGDKAGTANILASVGTSVGRLNLTIGEPPPKPVADFLFEVSGLSVIFTDASTNFPDTRLWTFGDGTQSTEQNPKKTYAAAGTYTVELTVKNAGGESSKSKFVTLQAPAAPVADFTFETKSLSVIFNDVSAGSVTSRLWSFGDGSTSTLQNPTHTYAAAGTYTVTLTVRGPGGESTKQKFVELTSPPPLVPNFTFETNGLSALFTDTSTGDPTNWSWSFGDGTSTSVQNPAHSFPAAGTYTVTLTISNSSGTTAQTSKFVTVTSALEADFTTEIAGLRVLFTDTSKGNPNTWTWDFGCTQSDCRSTERNPEHLYTTGGTYRVSLTVTNISGVTATKTKLITVSAGAAPVAAFDFVVTGRRVSFLDRSTGATPLTYHWSFGECTTCTSTAQNPTYEYAAAGTYTVVLTVTNASGSNSTSKAVTVVGAPVASFEDVEYNGLIVRFVDLSTGPPTSWEWNFGDCDVNPDCRSTLQHPAHRYLAAGTYAVTLRVRNTAGESTASKLITVPKPE